MYYVTNWKIVKWNEYDYTLLNSIFGILFHSLAGMFENIRQKPSIDSLKIYLDNL